MASTTALFALVASGRTTADMCTSHTWRVWNGGVKPTPTSLPCGSSQISIETESDMRVYLAGPMRGIPEFNFPAFMAAAKRLRDAGHKVFNPAEKDNERHGTDISKGNATGSEEVAASNYGFSLRDALGMDLEWICAHADAIALLPGW